MRGFGGQGRRPESAPPARLMRLSFAADKGGMETCHTWRCPGCGALVGLPAAVPVPVDAQAEKRLDQLAQAACGCWVDALSERGMARLLKAIVNADDLSSPRLMAGRRF